MSKLILSYGLTGTGKTTILKKFVKNNNLFYIDKDTINNAFLRSKENIYRNNEDYGERFGERYNENIKMQSYIATLLIGIENCSIGNNVILDGYWGNKLVEKELMNYLDLLCSRYKIKKYLIYFHCSKTELIRRLKKRGLARDKEKIENFDEYYASEIEIHNKIKPDLKINSEEDIETNLIKINKFLNN